jgi:hypothetical protein
MLRFEPGMDQFVLTIIRQVAPESWFLYLCSKNTTYISSSSPLAGSLSMKLKGALINAFK